MVEAFIGKSWKNLYHLALKEEYRFLSFGDAMFMSVVGSYYKWKRMRLKDKWRTLTLK